MKCPFSKSCPYLCSGLVPTGKATHPTAASNAAPNCSISTNMVLTGGSMCSTALVLLSDVKVVVELWVL